MLSALFALLMTVTPATASAPPANYPADGVDVASWQHSNGRGINWGDVHNAGIDFATIKATEGSPADATDYTNPWFTADLNGARTAGLAAAPYHFYLARTPNTGTAQANHFIAVLRKAGYTGQRPLDLPPVFDFEWDWKSGKCPSYGNLADAKAWLTTVENAFGRKPIIYTNRHFLLNCIGDVSELGKYPLQIAHYSATPPSTLPNGWDRWTMWQWTARDSVNGIPSLYVTRSAFNGSVQELQATANVNKRAGEPDPNDSRP